MQCEALTWKNDTAGGTCPGPVEACPASYGSNAHCSALGTTCPFPEGTCICSDGPGPVMMGGPSWNCVAPPPGCSTTRPEIGSPCPDGGKDCDYGGCLGGVDLKCVDGYWEIQPVICAK
jgi:hypothetical protein